MTSVKKYSIATRRMKVVSLNLNSYLKKEEQEEWGISHTPYQIRMMVSTLRENSTCLSNRATPIIQTINWRSVLDHLHPQINISLQLNTKSQPENYRLFINSNKGILNQQVPYGIAIMVRNVDKWMRYLEGMDINITIIIIMELSNLGEV